ncbi:glycosyltransferase family protein [Mucilaginibacter glaciei]|uniref:Glucosyltransferase 3-like C-terminal domain-containing protein n=1 Tax=Mucilaginibacter glaciei TaxID=2772109 RepID=A0A926NSS4_9SPHI|nr:hypothetical protein [Mucilaginibacter glaciei]MBD1393300.1 hypothetical protein [Mucilaginibacter glaciei]
MRFDFYVSAMSVSDLHGGGLTLQRVLGDDLEDIAYFIHVNRFGSDIPISPKFQSRSIDIPSLWDSDIARKILGRTLSAKLSRMPVMIKLHSKHTAKVIKTRFGKKRELHALICPQGADAINAIHQLKKVKRVKYITWVMDDHLLQYVNGVWQYPEFVENIFADHLRKAQHVFVISPAMQQFYEERFGVSSTVLFGSSDRPEDAPEYCVNKESALRIGYFGAVASWQHDALLAVKNAIEDTSTKLDIYSGVEEFPAELQSAEVNFKGRVAPHEVQTTMLDYDAMLLPISFEDGLRNMSQFNIATKMSEYLACGIPIVVVGPPYAAMVNYLQEHNAAIVISSNAKDDIINGMEQLRSEALIQEILKNAETLVNTEVGTLPMRKRWSSVVNS